MTIMIKTKLAIFLAAATLSLSAHAGFVQYNLSGAGFADGGSLSGYFVQNTDDQSIAYFRLAVSGGNLFAAEFFPSGLMSNIGAASTYYTGAGPTNFSAFNDQDVTYHSISLAFGHSSAPGNYFISGINAESGQISNPPYSRVVSNGKLVIGTIDPLLLASLESGPLQEIFHIVPNLIPEPAAVPEPGSLALLMLGMAGVLGARRTKPAV
jgi:hypothetical protein